LELLDVLRTRADAIGRKTTETAEKRALREQNAKLTEAQREMDAKITALTEELNKVKAKAREEAKKNRRTISELKNSLSQQIAESRKQGPQPRPQVATGILIDLNETVTPTAQHEPMELDPTPAPPSAETAEVVPTPPPRFLRFG